MRTTVDIEDRILERAKRYAAKTGQTLGALVSEALAAHVAQGGVPPADEAFELVVRGRPGGPFPSPEQLSQVEHEDDVARLRIPGLGRAAP